MSNPNLRTQATRSRGTLAGVAALLIAFTLIGVTSAVEWIGKPFAGFLVLGNGVVASAGLPGWPATRDGEIFQRTLVSIEGRSIDGPEELRGWLATRPEGSTLHYRLAGGEGEIERDIAIRRFEGTDAVLLFGTYLLNGILLGALALFLIARRELDHGTRSAAPFLACGALWGLSGMDLYGAHVLFRAHALCEALLFATALQMALEFPTRLVGAAATRKAVRFGYAVSLALALYYQAVLFDPSGYVRAHLVATSLGGGALVLVVVGLGVRYARAKRVAPHTALGVLAAGAAIALLLPVALTIPEAATGGRAPQNLVGWTVFVFPLAVGYAIRRRPSLSEPRASCT
ncbi:MAG: hypothetical protein ACQGVC_11405 [Myxococcota bacterium]